MNEMQRILVLGIHLGHMGPPYVLGVLSALTPEGGAVDTAQSPAPPTVAPRWNFVTYLFFCYCRNRDLTNDCKCQG